MQLNFEGKVVRVALYMRVSTEEQALHGSSMQAQEEALLKYAEYHNMKIVHIFRDEGNSARKPALERPVMLDLLECVKRGEIDQILFIKLDRWFRNVREYHKVQEILEKHNVSWIATNEIYRTDDSNGRLMVNTALSVAEAESDRTSERIRFVFNSKIMRKEVVINDRCAPFGYKVAKINGVRKLIKDEDRREMVEDFFKRALTSSIRKAAAEANEKYGLNRAYSQWHRMTKNPIFTGTYKGVEDFCEPYITKEEFAELTRTDKIIRKTKNNRVYLFTGLMKCPGCGRNMSAKYVTSLANGNEYSYYRCYNKVVRACTTPTISEKKVETFLLENVRQEMEAYIIQAEVKQAEPKVKKKKDEVAKLKEKLRRLNVAYQAGNMEDDEYLSKAAALKASLVAAENAKTDADEVLDIEAMKEFLNTDFEGIYDSLTKEEKRRMWRSIIEEIKYDGRRLTGIVFKA